MPSILINRNFALLWVGRSISNLGDYVFDTTLVLWIATRLAHGQSWAPLAVSGVFLAVSIPTFIVGPIAGVFTDRWDKRRTMLTMDAIRAALILLLALSAILPFPLAAGGVLPAGIQLGVIYLVVILATTCALFFSPSRLALIGDIVEEPHRPRASSLIQMSESTSRLVGPAIAAPLFLLFGQQWALIANALSFGISFLALRAVEAPPAARSVASGETGNVLRELAEGFRFFLGNRVLVTIVVSVMLVMLGFGALNALNIFFLTRNLHAATGLYGVLTSALGFGAVAGAALAGMLAQRVGIARLFWLSMVGMGVLVLAYSRMTVFLPAVALLFLLGVVNDATEAVIGPMVLHVTPRELIGRVSAVMLPAAYLASMLSTSLAGFLDSTVLSGIHARVLGITWGPVDTIFTMTGILTVAGGVYALVNLRGFALATTGESLTPTESAIEVESAARQCSFCRRNHGGVRRMVVGVRGMNICSDCIDRCNLLIAEEETRLA